MKVRSSPGAVPHATVHASHASPIKKTIGTGIGALDLGALEKAAQKLGLLDVAPKASLAEQNAAAFPGTTLRFAAPDDAARGFAQSAVAATLAAAVDRDQRRAAADKHPAASPEQHLMKLGAQALITHIRVAWGVDENLKGKSPAEVAERQRLSTAIVAELSGRLFREIPFERFFRDNPRVAQALLVPADATAEAALEARAQTALQAQELRGLLGGVGRAVEYGLVLGPADQKLLRQADRDADASPTAAYGQVAELIERAQAFLKNPPAKKLSADALAALKKAQKAPPPPTLEQMLAHADTRVAELTAEIAHAPTPTEKERFEGAMIGLAIGDALGGPTEFMSREELRAKHGKVTDMIGGGWLNLKPGEYTDDTQMAERMGRAIVEKGGFDLEAIGKEFVAWLDTDPKDVGGLTRQALELKRMGVPAEQAGQIPWVMSGYENAGNGSVMRAAPVGLLTAFAPLAELDATARASSAVTHADPRCTFGTTAINYATSLIIRGETDVLDKVAGYLADKSPILSEAILATKTMTAEELRTSGYSVHTVQAAFWALHHAANYVDGIVTVSNLGEDTDTAGATAGILLGAKFGLEGIPKSWRDQLQNADGLREMATQIHALARASVPTKT